MVEGEVVELWVFVRVSQQGIKLVVDSRRTVDAEDDAADGDQNHHDVQDVPERLEVRQTNFLDL